MRFLTLFLLTVSVSPAWGVTNVWFSPTGKGDGTSRAKPIHYYPDFIKWGLLGSDKRNDREVVMHFLPGEYVIQPIDTEAVQASDWRITILGEGARPEDTVLKLAPNHPGGSDDGGGNWVSVIDLGRSSEYIRRFVMENITVDGNWSGQTNVNNRHYLRSYKNGPVRVSARTGRIRNVIVRNYGAHGVMPQRTNDVGAGIEVFPLCVMTREEEQTPEDGDAAPWVVENCEATGFHGLYAGYATTLMAVVTIDPAKVAAKPNPGRRLIWFRGNQVRGNADALGVIGMGTAGIRPNMSGRVTWSDGAILNAAGFNTDTGVMRWLDFTNLLLLDAVAIGYLGSAGVAQPFHENYNISGNSVRLTGYISSQNYRDFVSMPETSGRLAARPSPQLPLGRPVPAFAEGLVVRGAANDVRLADNWFTTRASEQFNRLGPSGSRAAEFWPVHRLPNQDKEMPESPTVVRNPATEVDFSGNSLSSVPFDFDRMQPFGGGKVAKLTDGSSPLIEKRTIKAMKTQFSPIGTVERVALLFTNAPQRGPATPGSSAAARRFLGAFEIVCGAPTALASGKFALPVRLAIQPTPGSGIPGTQLLAGRPVSLEVLPGSLHP
ncbi:MAG TPA: hypothetical protein DCE44_03910, partial [Verrucomicrobiales bacterium]|nr:hypothetical protein [Verrucomicrobiales bacterium]